MASDLSSSKAQLTEVKELLLRLINPNTVPTPPPNHLPPVYTASAPVPAPVPANPSDHCGDAAHISNEQYVPCRDYSTGPSRDLPSSQEKSHVDPVIRVPVNASAPPPSPAARSISCPSGDTVPLTPNTLLQNFTNKMPIGPAVSTDMSASIGTMSNDVSPHHSIGSTPQTQTTRPIPQSTHAHANVEAAGHDGVTTRGMATAVDTDPVQRPPREKFPLTLLPRLASGALAANIACYVLHPDCGSMIVAEGRSGGSWKSPKQKFGSFCSEGEQMVQIHKINKPGLPLPFIEDRQPFTILDHALVKSSGSSIYVKWPSNMLVKKNKPPVASKARLEITSCKR